MIMNYDYSHLILTILRVSEEENSTIAYSGAACNMSSTCYGGVYQGEYTPTEVLSHAICHSYGYCRKSLQKHPKERVGWECVL